MMSLSVRVGLRLAVTLGILGCDPGRSHPRAADQRVDRVLAGLRPAVSIKGASPVRWTLVERMAAAHVPAVSIAVIDSGRVVWARGVGLREAGSADSVNAETLFQAQSISKAVAVSAMLRLVQQGKLSLDQDVNHYLTSWKVPQNRFTATEKVTLRRIASHSAGFTVHGFPGYRLGDSLPTVLQILDGQKPANNLPIRVDTTPGAIWRYSGGGITVMQQLLTDVTGEPFTGLLRRLVLEPLAMTRSSFDQPLPEPIRPRAASGHDAEGTVIDRKWVIQPELAAAGLWTTPTELAGWAIEVANAWAGRSTKIWSREIALDMLTPQKDEWGLGVSVQGTGRELRFGHGGANTGFRAELLMFPEAGVGAVVMTNGDRGGQVIDELFQSIAAEYGWPGFGQKERVLASVQSALLDSLVGEYDPHLGGTDAAVMVVVSRDGAGLALEAPGRIPRMRLLPSSADSFFTESGGTVLFTRDPSGRGVKINLGGSEATRRPR
jgi:CubicO group peptidase (beta-lactamase class C family)